MRLGQAADASDVAALDPDFVILATGSRPRRAAWHDNHYGSVADADEVIVSPPEPRGSASAIIVDQEGGFTAPTAAESLCHAGWTVQIITDLPFVAAKVDPTQVWFVRRRLKKAGVTLRGNSELRHDPGGWALVDTESDEISPVSAPDLIVYADLRSARDDLSRVLAETLPHVPVRRVGDALAPRGLLDAITEGARAGVSASSGSRIRTLADSGSSRPRHQEAR